MTQPANLLTAARTLVAALEAYQLSNTDETHDAVLEAAEWIAPCAFSGHPWLPTAPETEQPA